ncbi:hypothetical protein L3X38_017057 [Prunus dulcis]|uniref:Uncharacterized protein n=1 Tax=Prunus dulcis TaxID=3755 RepID=A0AAD4W8Z4_PRUDU|nr:hypothetical protein L3X38_017057 [Prunus dulcis]
MRDICNYDTYFIQKHDAVGVLGLIPEQKLTAALRMLAYGASTEQWKNCPTAWQGEYGNRKGQESIILEAVASFDCWVWHAFFRVAGSQNDLNVLGQSPVFHEVEDIRENNSESLIREGKKLCFLLKKVTGKTWKGVSISCKLVG